MKRWTAGAVAALAALAACGRADLRPVVRGIVASTVGIPVEYRYVEESAGSAVEVTVRLEDSFRYEQRMVADGVVVLERVVRDDAVAVRVLAPERYPRIDDLLARQQPDAAAAIKAGRWVVDPEGAPSVHARVGSAPRTTDPLAESLDVSAYALEAVSSGVSRFNPDSPFYSARDDPFAPPSKQSGELRFDVTQPPLPARQAEGQLPVMAHFRRMTVYAVGEALVRLEERISIDAHPDVRRARERGANRFLLDMIRTIKQGRGPEQIRERTLLWEITSRGGPIRVEMPNAAVRAALRGFF